MTISVPECAHGEKNGHTCNIVENSEDKFHTRRFILTSMSTVCCTIFLQETNPVWLPYVMKYPESNHCKMVGASKVDIEQEADEMSVVLVPYTVVCPGTVMIWVWVNKLGEWFGTC